MLYFRGLSYRRFIAFNNSIMRLHEVLLWLEFGIYNIGTGTETSFSRIVEIINQRLGTDIRATYVDNPIKNYVQKTKADISLAKSELGYEAKCRSLEDGIAALIKKSC